MKKSVLLSGKQGTGKTRKLNELMAGVDESKSTEMWFKDFQSSVKSELQSKYDVIAIDNVATVKDVEYLSAFASGLILIIATQKSVKELETIDLSAFDVVECSCSYPGDNPKMKTGIELIAQERAEQIEKHGRTILRDVDENRSEQLRLGAIRLIVDSYDRECLAPNGWDNKRWHKMSDKEYKDRLVIAGALIAAEIDRIQTLE